MTTTTTYGPFHSFDDMIADATERASYVQAALAIVFTATAAEQLNEGRDSTLMPVETFIDRMATQCGMVISVEQQESGRIWNYTLEDDRDLEDPTDPLNVRDVLTHCVATLQTFAGMQKTPEERRAALAAQRGLMALGQRPHPISSLPRAKREQTVHNMKVFGGEFVKTLAAAWSHADSVNARAIEEAFPHYFVRYSNVHWVNLQERSEIGA